MKHDVIDPDYQWKQAATQEGVDYGAVQKSFMDQSYGVVANKAKILFQDPFRLGFEIVHRNEKATKMVGIFAFRVNKNLLYAPTFFVNGEIKPADMLYRADVKRFVPLTEDWCSFLVRGVHENAGDPVDKNRFRQADAYMDRLAYPQRVKYASEEVHEDEEMEAARAEFAKVAADGSLWAELFKQAAANEPLRKLLPEVIKENGPEALEKLASFIEDSPAATKFVAENYTREELENVEGWVKKASEDLPQPAIILNMDPTMAKSASAREAIFDKGYELVDKRPIECLNSVIEEVGDGTIKELSSPGKVCVLLDNGELEEAIMLRRNSSLLHNPEDPFGGVDNSRHDNKCEYVYFPGSKELMSCRGGTDIFGDEKIDQDSSAVTVKAPSLSTGKCYIALSKETHEGSDIFKVKGTRKDGDGTVITICDRWDDETELVYAEGRSEARGRYISDETCFLEVKCESDEDREFGDPCCEKNLMSPSGVSDWIRSAGGVTSSRDVTVKSKDGVSFDIEHSEGGTLLKSARDLGWLEAHLKLAEDFEMTTDKAGEILEKAVDNDVTYRVYDSMSKSAYLTRTEGMQDWIQSYDPELQVRLDAPQKQVLSTYTPRRADQVQRYGDVYKRVPAENSKSADLNLPMDAVMNQSPEELAQMSDQYDLPHIFDHACVGSMATNSFNIVEQIKQYIPDLEAGVDRYFRILFLLRYRPGDFEEIYGKDDLVEFEQDLTEVAARAGENLLTLLQRFDPNQYEAQDN